MNRTRSLQRLRYHALATAVVLALAGTAAQAQSSAATIKGQLLGAKSEQVADQTVFALNKATGAVFRAKTLADGSYTLLGLPPGTYSLAVGSAKRDGYEVTVRVGDTAALNLRVEGETSLGRVTVEGNSSRANVKSSESGTAVTQRQIEALPQVTRNFLAFADLAPGVVFVNDPATGYTRIAAGAQSSDRVNVYIDGMSQKNDLTRGGISGQNESRGNPFPQSAIGEYKVITQGYKAEYGTVSSTAITAVTKSGTNTLQGDAFTDYSGGKMIAYNPLEKAARASGVPRPNATQWQYGASLGGAIIPDRLHYFVSYEGKRNSIPTPQTTFITGTNSLDGVKSSSWLQDNVLSKQYTADRDFREDLLFGKLTFAADDNNRFEMSLKYRDEKDNGWLTSVDHPDWGFSLPNNAINRTNKEFRLTGKWELTGDRWINEANAELLSTKYIPEVSDMSPFIEYKRSNWSGVMMSGRMEDRSRNNGKTLTLKDDFTYTGLSGHTVKAGVKLDRATYDVGGSRWAVPHYFLFINDDGKPMTIQDTGNTWLVSPSHPCNKLDGYEAHPTWEPFSCISVPAVYNKFQNGKIGLYLQDDIAVTRNLELNLGLRWDYEDNAFNNKYVTPQWVRNAFNQKDTREGAAPGQTYADSMAKGGVNINNYISNGHERKGFKGAIQPRLGLGWDIFGDKRTVLTAQMGRAYDRTPAFKARDELINNSYAMADGTAFEVWMLSNNLKMPYSDQYGLSLRQALGAWNTEVGVQMQRGHNEFTWRSAGRKPDGSLSGSPFSPDALAPTGLGRVLLGESLIETKNEKLFFSADKPYSKTSGWGASATLTLQRSYSNSAQLGAENNPAGQTSYVLLPQLVRSIDTERYRLVGTFTQDIGWGLVGSLKATYADKAQFMVDDCSNNPPAGCVRYTKDANHFEQVDVAVSKQVDLAGNRITFRMDVLNLFNKDNFGSYQVWGGWGSPDPNLGKPIGMRGTNRALKLSLSAAF